MPIEAAPTVRESLEASIETVEALEPTPAPAPAAEPSLTEAAPEAPAQETEAQRAERLRNKDGTFAKGKPEEKPVKAAPVSAAPRSTIAGPKVPRPSSWKKELEPHWDALPPEVQAYTLEREKQYATGVSTYKTEADRAKSVLGALAEFEPILQQSGITPDRWIKEIGAAHRVIATGSPQDKLNMVQQILANNRIPAQLAVQDAQGQWQLLAAPQPAQQQQPQFNPQDLPALVQKAVADSIAAQQVDEKWNAFTKDVQEGKYPHFETVKATMAGILQAGLAQDYPSAYEAALRLPQHAELTPVAAPQPPAPSEAERQAAERAKVGRARSQAVSVRSSTPGAMAAAPVAKDLRGNLSDAFDKVLGQRV